MGQKLYFLYIAHMTQALNTQALTQALRDLTVTPVGQDFFVIRGADSAEQIQQVVTRNLGGVNFVIGALDAASVGNWITHGVNLGDLIQKSQAA